MTSTNFAGQTPMDAHKWVSLAHRRFLRQLILRGLLFLGSVALIPLCFPDDPWLIVVGLPLVVPIVLLTQRGVPCPFCGLNLLPLIASRKTGDSLAERAIGSPFPGKYRFCPGCGTSFDTVVPPSCQIDP